MSIELYGYKSKIYVIIVKVILIQWKPLLFYISLMFGTPWRKIEWFTGFPSKPFERVMNVIIHINCL